MSLQDSIVVAHDWRGKPVTFYHPAVQSAVMFLGEFLCLFPYLMYRWRAHSSQEQWQSGTATAVTQRAQHRPVYVYDATRAIYDPVQEPLLPHPLPDSAQQGNGKLGDIGAAPFVFALPTLCDAASTTLMNIGLYYTSASVYQMLRGTVVFFAGAHRKLHAHYKAACPIRLLAAAPPGTCMCTHAWSSRWLRSAARTWGQSGFRKSVCALPAGLLTVAILRRRLHLHHWQVPHLCLIPPCSFVRQRSIYQIH
jgi:hypothetical protein